MNDVDSLFEYLFRDADPRQVSYYKALRSEWSKRRLADGIKAAEALTRGIYDDLEMLREYLKEDKRDIDFVKEYARDIARFAQLIVEYLSCNVYPDPNNPTEATNGLRS